MPKSQAQDQDPAQELDNLTQLVTSEHWLDYVKLLKQHKEYLQKEVNRFVRDQNMIEAYGTLCKYEDIDKIILIMKKRLEELRKEK